MPLHAASLMSLKEEEKYIKFTSRNVTNLEIVNRFLSIGQCHLHVANPLDHEHGFCEGRIGLRNQG